MREGVQVRLADPGQQFAEGRVAGGVGAQHQRVDEEADQVTERVVGAAGHRRADRHVLARAEPGQRHRSAAWNTMNGVATLGRAPTRRSGRLSALPQSTTTPAAVSGRGRARPVEG